MKKIIFVLPLLAMMVVGCSNPTNTETPEEKKTVQTPSTPQTPAEDKSPYEYVKPACVNLADYTYVGDYIFADTMNFAEWKYSNATENYLLAFEKIARVKNDNPATRIIRYNHNDYDTEIPVIKATKYKIYIKTSAIESATSDVIINLFIKPTADTYDGTRIMIKKLSDNSFSIRDANDPVDTLSNYVVY